MPSGADLEYARMLARAGVPAATAQGYDAARLEQIGDTGEQAPTKSLKELSDLDTNGQSVSLYKFGLNNGVDPATAINLAIASVSSGTTLVFPPGSYTINSQITVNKLLHFKGEGVRLIAASGLNGWVTVTSGGSGSSFKFIHFDSNNVARGALYGSSANDVLVFGCKFTGYSDANGYSSGDAAIKVGIGESWRIISNIFRWGGGLQLQRAVALNDKDVKHCIVSNNIFESCCMGIVVVGQDHIINGNIFRNGTDNAIYVTTSGIAGNICRDIVINGNTFLNQEECVVLTGGPKDSSEWLENVTVSNNVFKDWTVRAIALENRVRLVSILGNTLTNDLSAPGVYVGLRTQTSTELTEDLVISGNTFKGKTGFAALWLQSLSRCSISNNVFNIEVMGVNYFVIRFQYNGLLINVTNNIFNVTGTDQASAYIIDIRSGTATTCRYGGNLASGGRAVSVAGFTVVS